MFWRCWEPWDLVGCISAGSHKTRLQICMWHRHTKRLLDMNPSHEVFIRAQYHDVMVWRHDVTWCHNTTWKTKDWGQWRVMSHQRSGVFILAQCRYLHFHSSALTQVINLPDFRHLIQSSLLKARHHLFTVLHGCKTNLIQLFLLGHYKCKYQYTMHH